MDDRTTRGIANVGSNTEENNLHMDTDDLSRETYRAIIIEAEKFNHDLTLRFGVLAGRCKDENEYIDKAVQLINYLRKGDKIFLSDIFFGDLPDLVKLNSALDKMSKNIFKVQSIPMDKRHFDF